MEHDPSGKKICMMRKHDERENERGRERERDRNGKVRREISHSI